MEALIGPELEQHRFHRQAQLFSLQLWEDIRP
jgi:hypothetical protein